MATKEDLKRLQQENSLLRRASRSNKVQPDFLINLQKFRTGEISAKDVFKEKRVKAEPKERIRIEDPEVPGQSILANRRILEESMSRENLIKQTAKTKTKEAQEKRTFEQEVDIQQSQDILEGLLDELFDVKQDPTGAGLEAESTGQQIFQDLERPDEEVQAQQRDEVINFLQQNNKQVTEETIKEVVDQLNQGETLE